MTWLAVWLVGIGVADLARSVGRPTLDRLSPVIGGVMILAMALALGLTAPADLGVLAASLLSLALWVVWSRRVLNHGEGAVRALVALAGGAVWLLALSGWQSEPGGVLGDWLLWADLPLVGNAPVGRVVLLVGLGLVNVATANILVRTVLVAVGALKPVTLTDLAGLAPGQPSDELRGGRLLGPMERLLILGLGLAGQFTAAGLVIGAKGLIRFPELQAKRDDRSSVDAVGIDEVTEYFLIGSFVSWLVALGSLALTR